MAGRWNTSEVEKRIRAFQKDCERAAAKAASELAHEGLTRSSAIAPIEEGTMIRTGKVDANDQGAAWGFGYGGAEDYTRRQHEDLTLRHDNGREPKFVESVCSSMADEVLPHIGRRVLAVIR